MTRGHFLPPPPQMGNGGSPLAHLSSSSLSDPSWRLQFKWSQPPPRAPEWLFDSYRRYNPLPRTPMVARLHTKNGFNEPCAKTNRLPDCCRCNMGGPFFMGLALTRTAPTGIRRRLSTIYGRTSTRHSSLSRPLALTRRRLLLALARRRLLLALARRRLPAAKSSSTSTKSSSTSTPLVPARRLLLALAMRRLLLALARRRLHVANAPLKHARRLPPNSSSCGSAAVVSMPG
jgi:hypothetical protein